MHKEEQNSSSRQTARQLEHQQDVDRTANHLAMADACRSLNDEAVLLIERLRSDRLRTVGVLDTPPEPVFDELLELMADMCRYTGAMLTFIDKDRAYVKGSYNGVPPGTVSRDDLLCATAIESATEVLIIPDTAADERWAKHPKAKEVRTYAAKAVNSPDGIPLGAISLFHPVPKQVTDTEITALKRAASIVSHILAERAKPRQS